MSSKFNDNSRKLNLNLF